MTSFYLKAQLNCEKDEIESPISVLQKAATELLLHLMPYSVLHIRLQNTQSLWRLSLIHKYNMSLTASVI